MQFLFGGLLGWFNDNELVQEPSSPIDEEENNLGLTNKLVEVVAEVAMATYFWH